MCRAESAAIIGVYSRKGFYAERCPGGFLVESLGFRSYQEARRDTGVDFARFYEHPHRMAWLYKGV